MQGHNKGLSWNCFLVPWIFGIFVPLITLEPSKECFAFSIISVGQRMIFVFREISEAQLVNSKDVCRSIICCFVFSLTRCLHVSPNPSMPPFPWDVALKSYSVSCFIKHVEQLMYLCLKCCPAPSVLKYFLFTAISGWSFLNLSEVLFRKTIVAYLSWLT